MSGRLRVVGLGPGAPGWITPEASEALAAATDLVGYAPYLARLAPRPSQTVHASDNRVELDRARLALRLAQEGRSVAVVSGGDPGIFAMAAAVLEAVDAGDPAWRELDIAVCPGVSAMQAAAARLGAPLGHDFCAISLSDNLKPWPLVAQAAARRRRRGLRHRLSTTRPLEARPDRIGEAFALLRAVKAGGDAGGVRPRDRASATRRSTSPRCASGRSLARVDMSTLVLVGSSETRLIARRGARALRLHAARQRVARDERGSPPSAAATSVQRPQSGLRRAVAPV